MNFAHIHELHVAYCMVTLRVGHLVHVSGVICPCDVTNLAAPTPVLKIETLCIGDNRLFSQSYNAKQMERCIPPPSSYGTTLHAVSFKWHLCL